MKTYAHKNQLYKHIVRKKPSISLVNVCSKQYLIDIERNVKIRILSITSYRVVRGNPSVILGFLDQGPPPEQLTV